MSRIVVRSERAVAARPDRVFGLVRDYAHARRALLPASISDYVVEQGGEGSGTVVRYRMRAGRREREYRLAVEEEPGSRTVSERDLGSSLVNLWAVRDPISGPGSAISLTSAWEGAGGVGGFFERRFAPAALRRVQAEMLDRLAAMCAREG